jgi:phospholipase/lecithinase/hemolysin
MLRLTQAALASAAFAMLTACGGGGGSSNASSTPAGGANLQVVSFGDSLSDVGTYSPVISADFGGGRFTTNPGEIWTQKIAEYYGGTLTPAYEGGFGDPLVATGGYGYAQGGSDVTVAQGMGWAPNNMAATTVPVATQVSEYLSAHGSFNSGQLVLVNGGANDIFQTLENSSSLTAIKTAAVTAETSTAGQPASVVQQAVVGAIAQTIASMQLGQAAEAMASEVVGPILKGGATRVAVMNVPDIGNTPMGVAEGTQGASLLTAITAAYNYLLETSISTALGAQPTNGVWTLASGQKVVWIDTFTWLDGTALPNAQAEGFTVTNTATACNLTQMETNATAYATANPSVLTGTGLTAAEYGAQFGSSLFCSPQTLVTPNAATTYMFADTVHPATALHALFAQYVEQQFAAAGFSK